jgi:pyrroloquinoline quinone biosynthesis protein D
VRVLTKDPAKFVETNIEDETVVMALETGDFFSLKDTAKAIWDKIDGTRDRDAIVASLAEDYGVEEAEIADEIDDFLAELDTVGLLGRS